MPETRHFKFRSRPEAVAAARRALDGFERLLDLSVFYDASLCVSELVTNAVLHADATQDDDDELELIVSISDGALRVSVLDPGSGFTAHVPAPGDDGGWGLYIVDRLADRWGVDRTERTRVWFEIAARAGDAAAARSMRLEPEGEDRPDGAGTEMPGREGRLPRLRSRLLGTA